MIPRLGFCPCCHRWLGTHFDSAGRFTRCPEMIARQFRAQPSSAVEKIRRTYVAEHPPDLVQPRPVAGSQPTGEAREFAIRSGR